MVRNIKSGASPHVSNGRPKTYRLKAPIELTAVIRHHLSSFRPAEVLEIFHVRLTDREQAVLCAFLCHCRMGSAAEQLGTSAQTVRNQLNSIRRKFKTRSISELIIKVLISALRGRLKADEFFHSYINYGAAYPLPPQSFGTAWLTPIWHRYRNAHFKIRREELV